MLKVMTLVGTRPELIKMSRVIAEFDRHTRHLLVHTGQNFDYELNQVFFDELEIRKPDYFLDAAGENAARTIGQVIIRADEVLEKERPQAVLVYGDTNSTLAGALAAAKLYVPVVHVEAGLRSFNREMPEEINRILTDAISDLLFCTEQSGVDNLLREGVSEDKVHLVGNVMIDTLLKNRPRFAESSILEELGLTPEAFAAAREACRRLVERSRSVSGSGTRPCTASIRAAVMPPIWTPSANCRFFAGLASAILPPMSAKGIFS